MKRRIAAWLAACVILCGCTPAAPAGTEAQTQPSVAPQDPLTAAMTGRLTAEALQALPVASDSMTKAQLRQLCMDYFRLQLSFQWTPSCSVTDYPSTYYEFDAPKTLDKGTVYSGIPYQSKGTGNLYRWMEYYDEATGVFDIRDAFAENGGAAKTEIEYDKNGNETYYSYRCMRALFNQCSVASFWGWGRVINSANFAWTAEMNVHNGFIPVGGFTYGYTHEGKYYGAETIRAFGKKDDTNPTGYDTKHVIADWNAQNGADAMFRCYAQLQPADCLVSGGHAMMVREVKPVYDSDGTLDSRRSTVTVLEQTENWGTESKLEGTGIPYKMQGQTGAVYSFAQLQSKKYLPFTFAEFLEADDPRLLQYASSVAQEYKVFRNQAVAVSGTAVEQGQVYASTGASAVTVKQFKAMTVGANYPISDVFVTVKDPSGTVLLTNIYRATNANCREVSMKLAKSTWQTVDGEVADICLGLDALADGKNTVEVRVQLSTGEKLTAFTAMLTGK